MGHTDQIKQHFQQLLNEGQKALRDSGWSGSNYARFPPLGQYVRFRIQSANLIRRVCGENSDHYVELKRLAEEKSTAGNSFYLAHCVGTLHAAQCDFEAGILFDMRSIIMAEVLGDFIEQSEALLVAGYHVPAASLAGAVLEDTMRKMCQRHHIGIPSSTKIDSLNAELARNGVYDKLIQKRIVAIADIRNNADHGHFDKVTQPDVEDMIKWVRGFSADYLK